MKKIHIVGLMILLFSQSICAKVAKVDQKIWDEMEHFKSFSYDSTTMDWGERVYMLKHHVMARSFKSVNSSKVHDLFVSINRSNEAGFLKGQCVSFVKEVSSTAAVETKYWKQKNNRKIISTNDVTAGDVIASFTNKSYDGGHAAVVVEVHEDWVYVMDQNYAYANASENYPKAVAVHKMRIASGTSLSHLNRYSVVTVD